MIYCCAELMFRQGVRVRSCLFALYIALVLSAKHDKETVKRECTVTGHVGFVGGEGLGAGFIDSPSHGTIACDIDASMRHHASTRLN